MKYRFDDITAAVEDVILHGCNAQGVMGSGVALAIRKKWPSVFDDYKSVIQSGSFSLGDVVVSQIENDRFVFNGITQEYYGRSGGPYATLENVERCLHETRKMIDQLSAINNRTYTVALPKIGCGLGGLSWDDVEPLVELHLPDAVVYDINNGKT